MHQGVWNWPRKRMTDYVFLETKQIRMLRVGGGNQKWWLGGKCVKQSFSEIIKIIDILYRRQSGGDCRLRLLRRGELRGRAGGFYFSTFPSLKSDQ